MTLLEDPPDAAPEVQPRLMADRRYEDARKRQQRMLELLNTGLTIRDCLAHPDVKRQQSTYQKWRQRDPHFAAEVDKIRYEVKHESREVDADGVPSGSWDGGTALFFEQYFGLPPARHQLRFIHALEQAKPGDIILSLWPPEHGKTTTFENWAGMRYALDPTYRITIASEAKSISRKMLGRIKHRMEPTGPTRRYVRDWGPFVPQPDSAAQPWGADQFNVYKKGVHDERDYSCQALGYGSSIVSTRCDQLHIDDLQSKKTNSPAQSEAREEWVRQDALTRPGEHGFTSWCATRVGPGDVTERFMADDGLDGILHVLRFPAVTLNHATGRLEPLWPEKYDLDQLARMRKKVKEGPWLRNYMQESGETDKDRTFTKDMIEKCYDTSISLEHRAPKGRILYVGLDPALGGRNCVLVVEVSPERKLIVRGIREETGLTSNRQVLQEVNASIVRCAAAGARVTDLVIETMNFQKGLMREQHLAEMKAHYGFAARPHLTGSNKYDPDIGIPSMVTSFERGDIVLPWSGDDYTRELIGQLTQQLIAWRPYKRGNKLRMDMVMALWFVWTLWHDRHQHVPATENAQGWQTAGVPWSGTRTSGLIIPIGARV